MLELGTTVGAHRARAGDRPGLDWHEATGQDLAELHDWYQRSQEPFAVEISGPDPGMTISTFRTWCTSDATMLVARTRGELAAFLWLSSIQASVGVASIDWGFAPSHPVEASSFARTMRTAARALGLRKLHLMAMPDQHARLELASRLRFVEEGRLREHFFHNGKLNDLLCLGWVDRR
jgi:RimJ/RimL family protein N-acetyltransferase